MLIYTAATTLNSFLSHSLLCPSFTYSFTYVSTYYLWDSGICRRRCTRQQEASKVIDNHDAVVYIRTRTATDGKSI